MDMMTSLSLDANPVQWCTAEDSLTQAARRIHQTYIVKGRDQGFAMKIVEDAGNFLILLDEVLSPRK